MNIYKYVHFTREQLEKELSTSSKSGLAPEQVIAFQKRFGSNTLSSQGTTWFSLLVRQYNSAFTYLLFGAAVASLLVKDIINSCIIFGIVLLNGLLGFFQEYRAEQALTLLKQHLSMTAQVIRGGAQTTIDSAELVPGDLIILKPGDYIPADVRFIDGSLSIDESLLTGESTPAKKTSDPLSQDAHSVYEALNCGFLGTTVTSGSAKAFILATGSSTMFGGISTLTLQTARQSNFQERLTQLSRFLLGLIIITLITVFCVHLLIYGSQTNIIELLFFSIALTVGLTPEALPTVTTFALSRGALQLAKHNVIVKRLSAIEDLGAITILCTDKTGTLTENSLTVDAFHPVDDTLKLYARLACKREEPLDPFDKALKEATDGLSEQAQAYTVVKEVPFDPLKKRNTVLVQKDNEYLLITRGAFETLAQMCTEVPPELRTWITGQAELGTRVLAIASKKVSNAVVEGNESQMTLTGLVSFHDPIKPTVTAAAKKAHMLGITLKMITGDSKEVACAVAQKIGLTQPPCSVVTGDELDALSPEEREKAVITNAVFARISPEQKFQIINILKPGNVVGFLGEGINDAPALKVAHVGLAVQYASDIAKDAADIILLDKSLRVIIEGIAIGRGVFSNTIKYILASISSTFGNFYSIAIISMLVNFLPLSAVQILLINFLSDLPMISIATDTVDPDELKRPHAYKLKEIAFFATILGIVSSFFDFILFSTFSSAAPAVIQTNWFITCVFTELALIFSVRTKKPFYQARRPSTTLLALSATVALFTLYMPYSHWGQTVFLFQPVSGHDLLIIASIVVTYFIATELVKLLYLQITTKTVDS